MSSRATIRKAFLIGMILGIMAIILSIVIFAPKKSSAAFYSQSSGGGAVSYNYVSSQGTSVIKTAPGVLSSLTFDTVSSGTVLTVYDDASTTVISTATTATSTLTIGPSSSATSTATGTIAATFITNNGTFFIQSASISNGSTSVQAATALANAIAASSTALGLSAASSSNVINMTSTTAGFPGNFSLVVASPQLGFTINATTTQGISVTPTIAKVTIPGVTPVTLNFNVNYLYGLMYNMTTATSDVTFGFQ